MPECVSSHPAHGTAHAHRPVPPLPTWPLLLDLEDVARADPDHLVDLAGRAAGGSSSRSRSGGSGDTLDSRAVRCPVLGGSVISTCNTWPWMWRLPLC